MDADQTGWPASVHKRLPELCARPERFTRRDRWLIAPALALCVMAASSVYAADAPDLMPDTAIAPAEPVSAPANAAPRHASHPAHTPTPSAGTNAEAGSSAVPPPAHHHAAPRSSPTPIPNLVFEVEPAEARVPLRNETVAYLQPSKDSPQVEHLQPGQLVHVTGSTRYFLQLKFKEGSTAYILADDALLTVPADKIFRLTSDTPVLARPNKWSKQLAEVHQGHDVHVVGVALNYMRIEMKSGVQGYIRIGALE